MSIHYAALQLAMTLKPLIARLEIEPVGVADIPQDDANFMLANDVANAVMQIAYQAVQEVKEQMKDSIIKVMEGL